MSSVEYKRYQENLERELFRQYPLIRSEDSFGFDRFASHKKNYASLDITSPDTSLTRNILIIALQRASNPNDPTYCRYAAEKYPTFQEATGTLISDLDQGHLKIFQIINRKQIKFSNNRTYETEVIDWRLESEPYFRPSIRSLPHQCALEISQFSQNEKQRNKMLRLACKDFGIPLAIMSSIYLKMDTQEVLDLFSHSTFREDVLDNLGQGLRLPHISNQQDRYLLNKLSNILAQEIHAEVPNDYELDAYKQGLILLSRYEYLDSEGVQVGNSQTVQATDVATANAYFLGLTKPAHERLKLKVREPFRSQIINTNYEDLSTTVLLNANLNIQTRTSKSIFLQKYTHYSIESP
jgi:hypothetical protein